MTVRALLALVVALGTLALAGLQQRRMLHLLQLEHYENARLLLWARRRHELIRLPWAPLRAGLALAAALLAGLHAPLVAEAVALALALAVAGVEVSEHLRRAEIKPLVYTARAKRILVAALAPALAVLLAGVALSLVAGVWPAAICLLLLTGLTLVPACQTAGANRGVQPFQQRINDRFVQAARTRLNDIAPTVIGVTGSYGKTTTKVCIGAVLAQRDATLTTPASFNSYLGVVRAINENLRSSHRRFVVEMGMYRAGDIAALCELVHPTIGVITAIGPMHLERLGSIEAIQDAKAELALALPADGQLITNADDPRCLQIAQRVAVRKTLYGISSAQADVRAEHVRMADGRTFFELVIGTERVEVAAGLLGAHNVSNLLAAAAVGWVSGLDLRQIQRGLETVAPLEHRLQPIRNSAAGIVVIDDAYNSNPRGAAAALEVLGQHAAQRRILVTPGMVELGALEQAENEAFGRHAAAVCDHVILVGPRHTLPVRRGLEHAGFDADAIDVVRDLAGATAVLARLTRAGDVVLFENDLPDLYAEEPDPAGQLAGAT